MGRQGVKVAFGWTAPSHAVDAVRDFLTRRGCKLVEVPPPRDEAVGWPEVGARVGEMVSSGAVDTGIAFCWTGNGVAISAARVPGVRAAFCTGPTEAAAVREWQAANVLGIALGTDPSRAVDTVRAWLETPESSAAQHVEARRRLAVA